ncbi:MAG TPA: 16S rRNA (uracil(1498)-N(3))-methyltransferase [Anaeromyxobacteraceae bacterium]|nr:16S rRNA (uracil(1498)-N(3))-methyltransferase [Anaeromyxobacteraceae bacterium]
MNLVLLDPADLEADGFVHLTGRRASHLALVLRARPGILLRVGLANGHLGLGEVVEIHPDRVTLRVSLGEPPPARSPVDLILALPRPKILRKVLQAAASMGVGRIVLLGSYRVEKSYFASPLLEKEALEAEMRLGIEQGRDTILPEVTVRRFFKPFVEDELDAFAKGSARLLAHPGAKASLEIGTAKGSRAVLALGPEGGYTAYEARSLTEHGFSAFSLGPRILRVDTAVPYAVGQVELWLRPAGGQPPRPGAPA